MILVIDSNYIARRAMFSTPSLSHKGKETGTIFGFIRDLSSLMERFEPTITVFCFDGQNNKRKKLLPSYKVSRDQHKARMTKGEWRDEQSFYRQVQLLKDDVLPSMGFRNILFQDGYEADDLIATVPECVDGEFVIVSSDKDLYQLLNSNVKIWNPQKKFMITRDWFHTNYGIFCGQWVLVKAIAGCGTDNVPGVPGVGEKTAVKYIRGLLSATSKTLHNIEASQDLIELNKKLVRLPFPGVTIPKIRFDRVYPDLWESTCDRFGMSSITTPMHIA